MTDASETVGALDGVFVLDLSRILAGPTATQLLGDWEKHPKGTFALPHPSWRNTGWLKKNPWFQAEVLPRLQTAVAEVMT